MADRASPNPWTVARLLRSAGPSPSTTASSSRVAAYASAAGREGKMAQDVIEAGAVPSARGGRTA